MPIREGNSKLPFHQGAKEKGLGLQNSIWIFFKKTNCSVKFRVIKREKKFSKAKCNLSWLYIQSALLKQQQII